MAGSVTVLAVGTVGSVLRDLLPAFERETGLAVALSLANPAATVDALRRGDPADLAVVANSVWEAFAALPRVAADEAVPLCRTTFGFARKAGAPPADVTSMAAAGALLAAVGSLGLVERSGSTPNLLRGFAALGLADALAAKTRFFATGEAVAEALAHGIIDLGLTTTSELLSVPGPVLLGPPPQEMAPADTVSIAGVLRDAANAEGARRLLATLTSAQARAVFAHRGHLPA